MISTAVLLVPRLAVACAVCFTGRTDETRIAFLATTVLLSVLPVLLVGSFVWWLRRRARQIRDERNEHQPSSTEAFAGARPARSRLRIASR
jgi:hypothetical protein